jgi:hypothetical protein
MKKPRLVRFILLVFGLLLALLPNVGLVPCSVRVRTRFRVEGTEASLPGPYSIIVDSQQNKTVAGVRVVVVVVVTLLRLPLREVATDERGIERQIRSGIS